MNQTLPCTFPFPIHHHNAPKLCRFSSGRRHNHRALIKTICSSSRRRHHRRRLLKHLPADGLLPPASDQNVQLILTVEKFSNSKPVTLLNDVVDTSHLKLNQFIHAAGEAFDDLRTLVTVDSATKRVAFSCRKSTVQFLGLVVAASLVIFFSFKVLVELLKLGRNKFSDRNDVGVIYRRDRSLGGREVLVGKADTNSSSSRNRSRNDMFMFLLENGEWIGKPLSERRKERSVEKLPHWWPLSGSGSGSGSGVLVDDKEEYQIMANRLIRAIMDKRMRGEDISTDDIVQLRRICMRSGVRVSFETENTRNSFYRASVDFVLNCCEGVENQLASVNIDGEAVQHFIAGLAENIGLENNRAARMVSAAVAARTRSRFLQAWALLIQGAHSQAVAELLKICLIHRIFPPEENSAEMEMVARGLKKQLNVDQREFLFNMLVKTCGEETLRSVAEALGLGGHQRYIEPQDSKLIEEPEDIVQ